MAEPLVSVIVAVRNGAEYLNEALDSVALQHLENIEVIVIDDGSTDDSAGLAERHATGPRVFRGAQRGNPSALNEGIHQSRGLYLAFLDSDDVWPAARLVKLLAAFEGSEHADLAFGAMVNTNSALLPVGPACPARLHTAGLLRRTAVLSVGEFRTDVGHGAVVDWISRATSMGLNIRMIDDLVLFRRIHGDNMGVRQKDTARVDMLKVIRDHHARQKK